MFTIPMKSTKTITVLVMVRAGSNYETKKNNGISHFLEHMMFKGTAKRPTTLQIAEELDSIGGEYNAFTSKEWTGYYAKADSKHLPIVADIIADIFQNALLDPTEMEREKLVILEEMNMYQDTPIKFVDELAEELLYGDQPCGWKIIGEQDIVKSITRNELMRYFKEKYTKENTSIVVAGAIPTAARLSKLFDLHFAEFSRRGASLAKPVSEQQVHPRVLVQFKETDQTHLSFALRAYKHKSKNLPALKILNILLGGNMSSRLFINIREREGLGYYINSHIEAYTGCGYLSVKAGIDNDRVFRGIELILKELRSMRDGAITKDELRKAKEYVQGKLALSLETSDAQAFWLGSSIAQGGKIKTPEEALKEIMNVTIKDVSRVARDVIQNKNLNLAVIGPYKNSKQFEKIMRV